MRIVAGTARSRRFEAPPGGNTRPTLDRVRENLFNMLQSEVRGARVLDLFAGSGALSLEALRRGARSAVLVDRDGKACQVEQKNLETLGFSHLARVIRADWREAVRTLTTEGKRFDLIFLDPPYAVTDWRNLLLALEQLIEENGLIVAEHAARSQLLIPPRFRMLKTRTWGYCGVTFFQIPASEKEPESYLPEKQDEAGG